MSHPMKPLAVELRQRGYSRKSIARITGVHPCTIRLWLVPGAKERDLELRRQRYADDPNGREKERERKANWRAKKRGDE